MGLKELIILYLTGVMILASAGAVVSRNPIYSVILVLVMIFHQAFLFYFLGCEFLTAIQLIVYAGAVIVLFLFVVYLINVKKERFSKLFVKGSSLGLVLIFFFGFLILKTLLLMTGLLKGMENSNKTGNIKLYPFNKLATLFFQKYLFQFEFIGVVLLVVVLGAVFLLKKLERVSHE